MEEFKYDPIGVQRGDIRLLRLHRPRTAKIECELFQASLLDPNCVTYEALSYTWGNTELVDCITVNQRTLWITDHLNTALQYLRQDEDRILWIDAICINQADEEERGQQVGQMNFIFNHARQVIFWLGKATPELNLLMKSLKQLHAASTKHGDSEDWKVDDPRWKKLWLSVQPDPAVGEPNELVQLFRLGLQALFKRAWFERIWIIQEVANAQRATIQLSSNSIPTYVFLVVPGLLGIQPTQHCQSILDIMPGQLRNDSWWNLRPNIYTLLYKYQASKATDERDMIFALTGLTSETQDFETLHPDYTRPFLDVVNQAVPYFIDHCGAKMSDLLDIMVKFSSLTTVCICWVHNRTLESEDLRAVISRREEPGFVALKNNNKLRNIIVTREAMSLVVERSQGHVNLGEETFHESLYDQIMDLMFEPSVTANERSIQIVSWGSNSQNVQLLIIHDAVKALQIVSLCAYDKVLNLILKRRSHASWIRLLDIDTLCGSTSKRHNDMGEFLLNKYLHPGQRRTFLYEASLGGYSNVVKTLLKGGIVPYPNLNKNAVLAASRVGHKHIIESLLAANVDFSPSVGYFALSECADKGLTDIARLLLQNGAGVNKSHVDSTALQVRFLRGYDNGYLKIPLIEASQKGRTSIVELLLDAGADINEWCEHKGTSLQQALLWDHSNVLSLLFDRGADVNGPSGRNGSALQVALYSVAKLTTWKYIISKGAEINIRNEVLPPLSMASKRGYKSIVQLLIEKGADVNIRYMERTPIYEAQSAGYHEVVDMLIEAGADPYLKVEHGENLLSMAARNGSRSSVKLLLAKGVDINEICDVYGSALAAAASRRNHSILEMLLDRGANVDDHASSKNTALFEAIVQRDVSIISLLLARGANINHQNGTNLRTGLNLAVSLNHIKVAEELLNQGADPNLVTKTCSIGRSPLQIAVSCRHYFSIILLIRKGAKVDLNVGGPFPTALQYASCSIVPNEISTLVEKGADVNLQYPEAGSLGTTALQLACYFGRYENVMLLLEKGAKVNQRCGQIKVPAFPVDYTSMYPRKASETILKTFRGTGASLEPGSEAEAELLTEIEKVWDEYGASKWDKIAEAAMVKELVKLGRSCGAQITDEGYVRTETAIQAASSMGHTDIVDVLLKRGAEPPLPLKAVENPE